MTLTDEQLAEIAARLNNMGSHGGIYALGDAGARAVADFHNNAPTDIRALLDEVTALRHDVTRHMEIANEHLAEIERIQSHITAARSFRVLNENGQADRHLSEAMETNND